MMCHWVLSANYANWFNFMIIDHIRLIQDVLIDPDICGDNLKRVII